MPRSHLRDRGRERIYLYPEITVMNRRNEPVLVASDEPIVRRVNVTAERQAVSELNGQIAQKSVRVTLSLPRNQVGTFARIHFRGEDWDLAAPPHFSSGVTGATEHVRLILKDRNSLGSVRQPDPGPMGA